MKGYGFECAQNVTRSAVSGFFRGERLGDSTREEKAAPADWTSPHSLSITSHSGMFRGRQEEPPFAVGRRVTKRRDVTGLKGRKIPRRVSNSDNKTDFLF